MAVSPGYRAYVCGQIEAVKPVVARPMFGGVGLYVEGWFVGLLDDDTLYFKVDQESVKDYLKAGMEPFRPFGEGTRPMRYYEVPADVLENAFELEIWLGRALEAARDPRARTRPARGRSPGRRRLGALLLAGSLTTATAAAQGGTEIFVAPLGGEAGRLTIGTPLNVTARAGYDNQPSFTPDGRAILFSSMRDGQNDIMRLDLATRQVIPVTRTRENEYSPTVTPDGAGFTVIRDTTQYLTRFRLDGSAPAVVFERIRPVGYHAWLDPTTVMLFVLGSPATLRLADTRTGEAAILAWDIGRSLHRIPGRNGGSFIQRMPDGASYIMELDPVTRSVRPLVRVVEGAQDYAWTPGGSILMAGGNVIYEWLPSAGTAWREVARFEGAGLARISRLAVSPAGDWLALVADETPPAP